MKELNINRIANKAKVGMEQIYTKEMTTFLRKHNKNVCDIVDNHLPPYAEDILADAKGHLDGCGFKVTTAELLSHVVCNIEICVDQHAATPSTVHPAYWSDVMYKPNAMIARLHGYQVCNMDRILQDAATRLLLAKGKITLAV